MFAINTKPRYIYQLFTSFGRFGIVLVVLVFMVTPFIYYMYISKIPVVGLNNFGLSRWRLFKIWSASMLLLCGWCDGVGTKYKWSSMAVRFDEILETLGRILLC